MIAARSCLAEQMAILNLRGRNRNSGLIVDHCRRISASGRGSINWNDGDFYARPGIDIAHLQRSANDPNLPPWPAFAGISDSADPLRLDVVFAGGHRQYVEFFCALAEGCEGR